MVAAEFARGIRAAIALARRACALQLRFAFARIHA
jgi:hypothetical protein